MDSHVAACSPIQVRVEASLAPKLAELSQGRALVIDYFASRHCGVTIGDLRVTFAALPAGQGYADLEAIGEIRVLAERNLLDMLAAGVELRLGGPTFASHLALTIDEPERWLAFLEHHPGNRC